MARAIGIRSHPLFRLGKAAAKRDPRQRLFAVSRCRPLPA